MWRLLYAILLIFIFILSLAWGLAELITNWIWKALTFPFRGITSFKKHLKIAKFITINKGEKVLIYNYSNYKMVETYLFPLLDKSVVTYFITKEGEVLPANDGVLEFIKYSHLKGGYPYLLKVGQKSYWYRSLKKMVSGLKNGQIKPVYAQSQIHFFFQSEEE